MSAAAARPSTTQWSTSITAPRRARSPVTSWARCSARGLLDIRRPASVAQARRLVDRGTVSAAIVIPAGFSAAVARGNPARMPVLGNVDNPISSLVAESIARSYASRIDGVRIATAAAGGSARAARLAAAAEQPIAIQDVSTRRKELDPATFYAAGMAVFFLFFTVQLGVSSLLDERRDGTLARMLVAPVRHGSILVGKLLTSLVLGVVSMVVLAVATHFALGAHWGNPLGVALLIVAGVLAATAVMALVATLARTPDQAQSWGSMAALVLGMLGGSFFPIAQAGGRWPRSASSRRTHGSCAASGALRRRRARAPRSGRRPRSSPSPCWPAGSRRCACKRLVAL